MTALRRAARRLGESTLVNALIVASIGLAIGAASTSFSLLDAVLVRPLPIPQPNTLLALSTASNSTTSWPQAVWKALESRGVLHQPFAWYWTRFDVTEAGERQFVDGTVVSGGTFEALRLAPALGRLLTRADDGLEQGPDGLAAVISDRLWRTRFDRNPGVLGEPLRLGGRRFTIVGVLPRDFNGLRVGLASDVMVPLGQPSDDIASPYVTIMSRLPEGRSAASVTAALKAVQATVRAAANPYTESPYREQFLQAPFLAQPAPRGISFFERRYGEPLRVMFGVVLAVLLMACINLALLLLARVADREREIAVSKALGASTPGLALQLSLEGVLLAAGGAAVGLVLAEWGANAVVGLLGSGAYAASLSVGVDLRVFVFAAAMAGLVAAVCGIGPVWIASRADVGALLRAASGRTRSSTRFGANVMAVQVAVTVVLLAGAGLLLRTFWTLDAVDRGFRPDGVLTASLDLTRSPATAAERLTRIEQMTAAVAAVPGVAGADVGLAVPGGNSAMTPWVAIDAGTPLPQGPDGVYANVITPGWLKTMGAELLVGRSFSPADRSGAPGVAIVNATFADCFLGRRDVLGRTVLYRNDPEARWREVAIVGVVQNAVYRFVREAPPPTLYLPLLQADDSTPDNPIMVLRAAAPGDPGLRRAVARALVGVDAEAAVQFRALSEQLESQYAQERLLAGVAATLGAVVLLLAAMGIYEYSPQLRRPESIEAATSDRLQWADFRL